MKNIIEKLMSVSEHNAKKVIELINQAKPMILWIGDEADIEEYEKWADKLEEMPIECDPVYEAWCEEQIRLSKVLRLN